MGLPSLSRDSAVQTVTSLASHVFEEPSVCLPARPMTSWVHIGTPVPSIPRYMGSHFACLVHQLLFRLGDLGSQRFSEAKRTHSLCSTSTTPSRVARSMTRSLVFLATASVRMGTYGPGSPRYRKSVIKLCFLPEFIGSQVGLEPRGTAGNLNP
jgi:hypothetical protein